MKKLLKITSSILSFVLILCIIPIAGIIPASAATTVIGKDIDTWSQAYIDERQGNTTFSNLTSLSLTDDVNCIRSGKGLKFEFEHGKRINFSNKYWNPSTDVSDYSGVKYWVYNPCDITIRIVFRGSDGKYSLKRGAEYIMTDVNGITTSKRTTYTYTSSWSGDSQFGEVHIPAGFKGTVYMPFSSFYTAPSAIGTYRLDFFTDGTSSGILYYDALEAYSDVPSSNLINDFESDVNITSQLNSEASVVNDGSYKGNALKICTSGTSSTTIIGGYSAATTSSFSNLRMYIKNSGGDANISFAFKNMSLKKNTEYYIINKSDGIIQKATTAKNIFPNEGGDNLADISIPSGFEGWVYLPISGISNQDGSVDAVIYSDIKFDISYTQEGGVLYIDHIIPETSKLSDDKILVNHDNYTKAYIDELNTNSTYTSSTITLDIETENVISGQGIKFTIDGTSGAVNKVCFTNKSWVPSSNRTDEFESIGFWFKNPSENDVMMVYRDGTNPDGSLKNSSAYYLKYSDSTFVRKTAATQMFGETRLAEVIIPSGFEGYVILPFTSFKTLYDTVGTYRLDFKVVGEAIVDIYMDNYTMFAANAGSVPSFFSDGAIFQQNKPINIWGENFAGTLVTAELYKGTELIETVSSNANGDGRFDVSFSARSGGYDEYRVVLKDSKGIFAQINDVLIGELWLSGGQSNMEYVIGSADSYTEILEKANDPALRFFIEPTAPTASQGNAQPAYVCDDIPGAYWEYGNCTSNALKNKMSAVACVFAYNIKEKLDVPVGVINTAVGGTRIDAWLARNSATADSDVLSTLIGSGRYYAVDQVQTAYTWTALYNQKIGPLAGLNIAGTIWYQGESNSNTYSLYAKQLDLLKKSWGEIFNFEDDSMPFIFTQVAPDCYDNGENNWFQLGYLAEAMTDGFKMNEDNNTAMLTLYDVSLAYGNPGTIHPNVKIPVGERFANAAMTLCYGGTAEASAPIFDSIEIKGDTVYVNFTHTGKGLSCKGNDIHGFTIAGSDGVYVNARAKIVDNDTVMVWNDYLKDPVGVTYAFANMNQAANLVNSSGLPAAPFRSDRNSATYITIEEWMNADADAWESVDGNMSGIKPSWTVTSAEGTVSYSYSQTVKTEGEASLAVAYSNTESVSVSPVINNYDGKSFNAANYKSIKFDVKAGDASEISLVITDRNGNTYNAYIYDSNDTGVLLNGSDFNTVIFALDRLYNGETIITDVSDILTNANISFYISGLSSDTLYIDNISVGLTEKASVFGDVNDDGEINANDLVLIKKHLLGIECEANLIKCDANLDENVNIIDLIRVKKSIAK